MVTGRISYVAIEQKRRLILRGCNSRVETHYTFQRTDMGCSRRFLVVYIYMYADNRVEPIPPRIPLQLIIRISPMFVSARRLVENNGKYFYCSPPTKRNRSYM